MLNDIEYKYFHNCKPLGIEVIKISSIVHFWKIWHIFTQEYGEYSTYI